MPHTTPTPDVTVASQGVDIKDLIGRFEKRPAEVVFEWSDPATGARGWTVINSLRGGAAGGGTRMRPGLDRHEVESLAKTMEIKFTVSGPAIGGAKSGIDFDPNDPRRDEVLARWFRTVTPLLKNYYGTGGDMNVDEIHDVIPITETYGLWHPQEGVVTGHFGGQDAAVRRIGRLRNGVTLPVVSSDLRPGNYQSYAVADLVTGYGVAAAVHHHYAIYGGDLAGKRFVVQGWGNVGAAAAYYLAQHGALLVGVLDRDCGLVNTEGLSFPQVEELFLAKKGNQLIVDDVIPFAAADNVVWDLGAEIFLPCAASRLVTRNQLDRLIVGGLEVISSGANVPFADRDFVYGPTYEFADNKVSVIPDFIANCGMARAFAFLMSGTDPEVSDSEIFADVSDTIHAALIQCHDRSSARTKVAATALAIALEQLAA